jgi:ribosomal protein L34E
MIEQKLAERKPSSHACPHCGAQLGGIGRSRMAWHAEAVKLRAEGWTYVAIAQRFGVTHQAARQAVLRFRA